MYAERMKERRRENIQWRVKSFRPDSLYQVAPDVIIKRCRGRSPQDIFQAQRILIQNFSQKKFLDKASME